jgi:hypothetical protein
MDWKYSSVGGRAFAWHAQIPGFNTSPAKMKINETLQYTVWYLNNSTLWGDVSTHLITKNSYVKKMIKHHKITNTTIHVICYHILLLLFCF